MAPKQLANSNTASHYHYNILTVEYGRSSASQCVYILLLLQQVELM